MTVSFTLTNAAKFPNATSVAAYPASNWPGDVVFPTGAPVGSATDTQTMTSSTLTFAGLADHTRYYAYASVGGVHTYVGFTSGEVLAHGSGQTDPANIAFTKTAFTQTYSTAATTVPNATVSAVATTAATQTTPYGYGSAAQADAVPVAINALAADVLALKKVLTAVIDDLQANNLAS